MPPRTLPEQYRGAGSPSDQTAGESQSGISLVRFRGANDSGYRDGEHDPQGTGHLVGEGRHRWAGRVRYTPLQSYHRCLKARANHLSCSDFQVCNTSVLTTHWLQHQGVHVSLEVAGQAIEAVAKEH